MAAKMADKNNTRTTMRKSGAGSTRNMDKSAFLAAYKEGLEAKGIDAEEEFNKLDADGRWLGGPFSGRVESVFPR